jgi:hypothetical protein
MRESVVNVVRVVVVRWETSIWLLPVPNGQRVPVSDDYPDSKVKLSVFYNHGVLNVLLGYKLEFFLAAYLLDLNQVFKKDNTPAP